MNLPLRGLWIDDSEQLLLTRRFWDRFAEHHLSTAAFMLESLKPGFDPRYSVDTLRKVCGFTLPRDIENVVTVWPEPRREWLRQFEEKIGFFIDASAAAALEFDLEGNWLNRRAEGFDTLDEAGDELVAMVQRVSAKYEVRVEITTYPYHQENSRTADVAPHADRLLPQGYSVRKRKGSKGEEIRVEWDAPFGPDQMQKLTLQRAAQVPGVGSAAGPLLSLGLAAYDQTWPGHKPEDAMAVAWKAACAANVIEARWWSSKWVLGAVANGYASAFLRGLPPRT